MSIYERGSEWRQWDLHIHSPASFHWHGKRFGPDTKINRVLIDEMIAALNVAEPTVFALMDYWSFDGWFALQHRLKEQDAPQLNKRVFPGIELRLAAPTTCRLNAHVIFSDQLEDQALQDFRSALQVEIISRPLSDTALVELARIVGDDKLKVHGFKKSEILNDSNSALLAGAVMAEVNCDSYKAAIEKVPKDQAVGFMPFDTSDGLTEVKWQEHYAYFLGLFKSSPIFETRNDDLRCAFVGEKTAGNSKWFDNFQADLGNVNRLAVSGSDAHRTVGVKGNNDKRGYEDFPSSKATWIKADPTFLGLLQAIKEPAKRSYVGVRPDKLIEVSQNKTFFIDRVKVLKNPGSSIADKWLSDCDLPLNSDLIAIIGNKGSGKSALADVMALLGNSKQIQHFSFLSSKRFRAKPKDLAKHFMGEMIWCDGSKCEPMSLSNNPEPTAVELVRYIPQAHFETLCNDHVTGRSDVFEKELRAVIFAHTSPAIRQKALDFDQLIEQQEGGFRDQLGELRKDLRRLNQDIEGIEAQLQPDVRRALEELLNIKNKQIEEHNKIVPETEPKPSAQLTPEQEDASIMLEGIGRRLKELDEQERASSSADAALAATARAANSLRDRIRILQRQYNQFKEEAEPDLMVLGLELSKIAESTIYVQPLDDIAATLPAERQSLADKLTESAQEKEKLLVEQANCRAKLNEPQLRYQQSIKDLETWELKFRDLKGAADVPDSLEGIKARLQQLDALPAVLEERTTKRLRFAEAVFDILEGQRNAREQLFAPVQDVIQSNRLIRDDYKLQFQASLGGSPEAFATALFSLIKQNSGDFRGEEESHATIKRIAENLDLGKRSEAIQFITQVHERIVAAANNGNVKGVGISPILRVGRSQTGGTKSPSDVYDLLFGLSFLEPRYSLLFQETQIEQLSPGQRGALLLIFYLLVDKGHNPIILDQPEENLDNETVVSLLVPVLNEAKKKRQIIMVTHNPNLAVVCDAEQVIYSTFDRKGASTIRYLAGAIENPLLNRHVVNVLEGTKPAFDNRRFKYHDQ